MEKYLEILSLRESSIETEKDAIKIIKTSMKNDIVPFVPLTHLLQFFEESKYEDFVVYLKEQYRNCAKRYYFGRKNVFGFIKEKPYFTGDYRFTAMDLKCLKSSKIILGRPSDNILFTILVMRPLTLSEYSSLLKRFPETSEFVQAALGVYHEKIFNKYFEEKTNTSIPFPLAEYLADVFI